MSLIRDRIIESAVRHFSEKGYVATSIQDISDDCGIAKGSLYKFFPSKEELFKEVQLSQQDKFNEQLESIRLQPGLSAREIFMRETEVTLEFFLLNKFIMQEMRQLIKTKKEMAPFVMQMRTRLLDFHQQSLIRLLGEEIKPHIWDIATVYSGMVKEFNFLMIFENKPLRVKDISFFVVERLEEIAANILAKQQAPVLTDALMGDVISQRKEGKRIPDEQQRDYLLEAMLAMIKELVLTNSRRAQLTQAVEALADEFKREQPKVVIIQALISFLQLEHELKSLTLQLEKFLMDIKQDRTDTLTC
ncbi:hypothetical protein BBD42_06345 [Paenibacillus sp. BIHB 4019]|uniref:HTH tetR-type domain-containing protein n=1 Tax=Paenibacillus sp. BIHB 4019 TaxID=1870819 RepID=A0A1B2DEL1_9BACL|nr:TetR/AcrR family transcriptional regulator [Paenibacillus sp. BIHB 4019]ANY66119.1 hypothetical protein BBD42_06345 [Paenibacillus sp. BIHB 4019]